MMLNVCAELHNQTVNDGVAHSKNPKKCAYHVTFDLDLENILDAGLPVDHRVQVWWRSGHLPARRIDFRASTKVPISRDPWPWPWPWAHAGDMLTRRPSCARLVAIRPFVYEKKRFAQKFTDRQTDRRRTPRHCISSFLEWAKNRTCGFQEITTNERHERTNEQTNKLACPQYLLTGYNISVKWYHWLREQDVDVRVLTTR